jgi:hypothetical protein
MRGVPRKRVRQVSARMSTTFFRNPSDEADARSSRSALALVVRSGTGIAARRCLCSSWRSGSRQRGCCPAKRESDRDGACYRAPTKVCPGCVVSRALDRMIVGAVCGTLSRRRGKGVVPRRGSSSCLVRIERRVIGSHWCAESPSSRTSPLGRERPCWLASPTAAIGLTSVRIGLACLRGVS